MSTYGRKLQNIKIFIIIIVTPASFIISPTSLPTRIFIIVLNNIIFNNSVFIIIGRISLWTLAVQELICRYVRYVFGIYTAVKVLFLFGFLFFLLFFFFFILFFALFLFFLLFVFFGFITFLTITTTTATMIIITSFNLCLLFLGTRFL